MQAIQDQPVNWKYWSAMKTLSAGDAAQLMVGINPDLPANKVPPAQLAYAQKIYRLAKGQEIAAMPIFKWLEWANGFNFKIHPLFALKAIEAEMAHRP